MGLITSIMIFLIGSFFIAVMFFERILKWRHFKKLLIVIIAIYVPLGIWEIFLRKSDTDKSTKDITSKVDSSGKSINVNIDTTGHLITHNTDSNAGAIIKSIPKYNPVLPRVKGGVKQESKEGDNNNIGRDNNGIQGNSNSHNHIVTGKNNKVGINGDVNIGNMPKEPTQEMLSQIEDSIKNKQAKINLIESTTNLANRTFCEKLAKLLTKNGYSNVNLGNYNNVRMGTCPEPGIHISGTKNGDYFTICVSQE